MKKGFTLVELLIVMVVVSVLVTIALPAYKTAMEKGRALEGIANAEAISEAMNVYYIRNNLSYGTAQNLKNFVLGSGSGQGVAGITQSKFFGDPTITLSGTTQAKVEYKRLTGQYTLTFVNQNGKVTSRTCTSNTAMGKRYCRATGLTSMSSYR